MEILGSATREVELRLDIRRCERTRASMNHCVYLQRTNCPEGDPARFWQWYIQFQQAGAAFRTSKSDLWLRLVFHQQTERMRNGSVKWTRNSVSFRMSSKFVIGQRCTNAAVKAKMLGG